MADVLAFKLITGEEVVAEATVHESFVGEETSKIYTLRKPLAIRLQMGGGGMGLALIPWTLANDSGSHEVHEKILLIPPYKPASMVEKEYLQQTSGIDLSVPGRI